MAREVTIVYLQNSMKCDDCRKEFADMAVIVYPVMGNKVSYLCAECAAGLVKDIEAKLHEVGRIKKNPRHPVK